MSIRTAIIGPTGYTGLYLIELLVKHPQARLSYLASHREQLPNVAEVFPRLLGVIPDDVAVCRPIDPDALARAADVVFLALPHRAAMEHVPGLLERGLKVVDLSADYRLKDAGLYESVYQHEHTDAARLGRAVYGLPELYREQIAGAELVANPGCYPTAAALALCPMLRGGLCELGGVIINATSGVTGAGRGAASHLQFAEQNEAFGAYGQIGGHRHQAEIEQTLTDAAGGAVSIVFVPHLLPVDRGILQTIYLTPSDQTVTEERVFEALEEAYDDEPFVRVRNELPNIKHVVGTNFCDVTGRVVGAGRDRRVVLFSVIDNLIKGASGQAVQNMNLMFGLEETAGLLSPAL